MSGNRDSDVRHFVVLSKLDQIGQPMNMLEIGFTASAPVIRNMAARGLVKVVVEITTRGQERLSQERLKRARQKANADKKARLSAGESA